MNGSRRTQPEKWLPVVGYEGLYEVSDRGSVRTVARMADGVRRRIYGRLLRTPVNSHGYPAVTLRRDGESKLLQVHRLVAIAFIGQPPAAHEVAHNDGTRTNNHVSNLRWATRPENIADKTMHGTNFRKLTPSDVLEIRRLGQSGTLTQQRIAEQFGIERSTVGKVLSGRLRGDVKEAA